jgi:arylsulfatase A-like enzyme
MVTDDGATVPDGRYIAVATCLDLAGARNDKIYGLPLTPGFGGSPRPIHDTMNWAILGGNAARKADWKLVRHTSLDQMKKGDVAQWELYNIAEDRTELQDRKSTRLNSSHDV